MIDIPDGVNPLTQLSAREMVLPARIADSLKAAMSPNAEGSLGQHFSYHSIAPDSPPPIEANEQAASAMRQKGKGNMRESLLRRREVQARVGLGSSQLYLLIKQGKFPKPIPLVGRTRAWIESDIDQWIQDRIKAGRESTLRGNPFQFNDCVTLIIPPITLGDFERLANQLKQPDVSAVIDATFAALKRNYPEMSRDQVAALIDMNNKERVFQAVMATSFGIESEDSRP